MKDADDAGAAPALTAPQKLKSVISAMPIGEDAEAATVPAADTTGTMEVTRLAAAWASQIVLPAGPKTGEAQESAFPDSQALQPVTLAGGAVSLHTSASEAKAATTSGRAEHGLQADQAMVFEASTHVLEVGVATALHGWLRVRAEVDGGGAMVAQVVATNAAAAEGLHKEMPALAAYLADEHVLVSSLAVHATHAADNTQHNSTGEGGSSSFVDERGASGRSGGQEAKGTWAAARDELKTDAADSSAPALSSAPMVHGSFGGLKPGLNGGWLSIRV